jgi:hypothetical protein
MEIGNFKDMYIVELQELASVGVQLADALLRMAKVASHPTLGCSAPSSRGHRDSKRTARVHAATAWRR